MTTAENNRKELIDAGSKLKMPPPKPPGPETPPPKPPKPEIPPNPPGRPK